MCVDGIMGFFADECWPVYVELVEFKESPLTINSAVFRGKTINELLINPLGPGCLRIHYHMVSPHRLLFFFNLFFISLLFKFFIFY